MSDFNFDIQIAVDAGTGAFQTAYLRVRKGEVDRTEEFGDGSLCADYSADGVLLGVEFLAPGNAQVIQAFVSDEPDEVQRFFRTAPVIPVACGAGSCALSNTLVTTA